MNLARLRVLLAVWVVLATVPGLAVGFAALGSFADASPGWALLVWIGGFIAQLVAYMAAGREGGFSGKVLPALFMSLGPFVVDWGFAFGWWLPVVFTVEFVALAFWLHGRASYSDALQRTGVRARAEVLEVERGWMNVVINNIYVRRTLRVRVVREDGVAPYETKYRGLFEMGTVPDAGDTFAVVVDPGRPQRIAPASGSGASGSPAPDYSRVAPGTRFTSWHSPAPDPPAANVTGSAAGRTLAANLALLAGLHQRGELSDQEFEEAKQRLLTGEDSPEPGTLP